MKRLFAAAVTIIVLLSSHGASLAQDLLAGQHAEIKNAAWAIYLEPATNLVATLRAAHVFSDFETRGFFRIGALPLIVLDGLTIEVHDGSRLHGALSRASEQFAAKSNTKNAVEGRDFSLSFTSDKSCRLRARTIRLENGHQWRLQGGSFQGPDGGAIAFRRATLTVVGSEAGDLVYETTSGVIHTNLLKLLPKQT